MNGMNLIYNPDHQQVLDHHKELLKTAEQERLTRLATETPKRPLPSFRKWLQHWLSDRRSAKMTQAVSQSSNSNYVTD